MILQSISLQNFRSYKKASFDFQNDTTFVVGPNTSGKTNIMESIYCLLSGKSFFAEKTMQMISFGKELARIQGKLNGEEREVVFTTGSVNGVKTPFKKYLINGVSKRRLDFAGSWPVIIFTPLDLELVSGSPGQRRRYLDMTLEQTDSSYRLASIQYEKALRQRNALLHHAQEEGRRNEEQFEYWDRILIQAGNTITQKREEFLNFVKEATHTVFPIRLTYDKSVISKERLEQYKEAEVASGMTLVGPQRDEILLYMKIQGQYDEVKLYASRGQQRLVVLQLKILQHAFLEQAFSQKPLLLLDDIFSELDEKHIQLVATTISSEQTIITTTHEEFIQAPLATKAHMIKLGE